MKMCGVKKCIVKPVHPLDLISKIEFRIEKQENGIMGPLSV